MNIKEFVEVKNWGWNIVTYSFLGTLVFGFVFGWGLFQQIRTIRWLQSGKSIPMMMNIFFACHFLAFSVYGFRIHSLAIIINGTFGFLYYKIYREASIWPDSGGTTHWQYVFGLMPFIMALVPKPDAMLSLQFVGTTLFLLQCPLEIFRKKDAGSVELKSLFSFIVSASFWSIFSACIAQWTLFVVNIIGIVILSVTVGLWFKYRPSVIEAPVKT